MTTATEKYINKAIKKAKEELGGTNTTMSNVNIDMHMEADGATLQLATALAEQAKANKSNSDAMLKLAEALKPIDVCAIRIDSGKPKISNYDR